MRNTGSPEGELAAVDRLVVEQHELLLLVVVGRPLLLQLLLELLQLFLLLLQLQLRLLLLAQLLLVLQLLLLVAGGWLGMR